MNPHPKDPIMTEEKLVPVEQDREAAADLLDEIASLAEDDGIGQVADLIRDGEYDEHDAVRAFARHRLAAEHKAEERIAELETLVRRAQNHYGLTHDWHADARAALNRSARHD